MKKGKAGPTPITEIFIPDGQNRVDSELSKEIMTNFWNKSFNHWEELANYIMNIK